VECTISFELVELAPFDAVLSQNLGLAGWPLCLGRGTEHHTMQGEYASCSVSFIVCQSIEYFCTFLLNGIQVLLS
jgi:hypothetical protein